MPVTPPVVVDATSLTPSKFGLITAATVTPEDSPRQWVGTHYEVNPGGPAQVDPNECLNDTPVDRDPLDDGIAYEDSLSVVLFGGFTCKSVGLTEAELGERASRALINGESPGLEAAAWNYFLGEEPFVDADVQELLVLPAAGSLVEAVAMLEEVAYAEYGGTPVIHAPRGVAAYAARYHQARRESTYLETVLGSRWSFGNYPKIGPNDAAGTWLVITGQVDIRRGSIVTRGGDWRGALDRTTNDVYSLAQRPYSVQVDGFRAAIQVTSLSGAESSGQFEAFVEDPPGSGLYVIPDGV